MIHIGQKIEEVLRVKRFPIVEFARRISTTRNNVYNIFSRESIDTELLRKIGEILEYDFFDYLSKSITVQSENKYTKSVVADPKTRYKGIQLNEETDLKHLVLLLQKENEQLKERLTDKEEIIDLMKKEGSLP
jgi:hypothetical protein